MPKAAAFTLVLLASVPLLAQDSARKLEVFGGYMLTRVTSDMADVHANWNGWNAAGTYFFRPSIGITADVSGMYRGGTIVVTPVQGRSYSFLFGPTWKLRKAKVNPFAHVLWGFERDSIAAPVGSGVGGPPEYRFAGALGGGLDIPIRRAISLRAFQLDFVHWQKEGLGGNNNLRLASGILFRFGY